MMYVVHNMNHIHEPKKSILLIFRNGESSLIFFRLKCYIFHLYQIFLFASQTTGNEAQQKTTLLQLDYIFLGNVNQCPWVLVKKL